MAEPSEYQRGVTAGGVETRLANHDKHFARINGSLEDMVRQLEALVLAVQRLGDQAVSRDATVITTASALKDAEEARRTTAEQQWSPKAKMLTVVGTLIALAGLFVAVLVVINR